jgi:hypothetical protein
MSSFYPYPFSLILTTIKMDQIKTLPIAMSNNTDSLNLKKVDEPNIRLEEDTLVDVCLENIPRVTPVGKLHATFAEMAQFAVFHETVAKAASIEWRNNSHPHGHFTVFPLNVAHKEKAVYYGYTCI